MGNDKPRHTGGGRQRGNRGGQNRNDRNRNRDNRGGDNRGGIDQPRKVVGVSTGMSCSKARAFTGEGESDLPRPRRASGRVRTATIS